MKLLGAIIAGGRSTRFGSDKGAALLGDKALIDHVADGLRPQVDALVIVGRDWPGLRRIEDRPAPDLGPLGGLCGVLAYAASHGFGTVMTVGCDTLPVWQRPSKLLPGQAVTVEGHHLFGLWPSVLTEMLARHLATSADRSMRHWIRASGAHIVPTPQNFHNLNSKGDLARFAGQCRLSVPPPAP